MFVVDCSGKVKVMQPNRSEIAKFQRLAKPQANGCWLWTGEGSRDGYGMFKSGPGAERMLAHKWSYLAHVGPIPEGLQLDHKCHTEDTACAGGRECMHRRCVNPEHLEPVTASENTLRQRHYGRSKTECPKGHPYTGNNLITGVDGRRRCRECDRARKRQARE